jgi:hypothetical protein
MSSVLTTADLLTWKSGGEIERGKDENTILEFAQQYKKLIDEEK